MNYCRECLREIDKYNRFCSTYCEKEYNNRLRSIIPKIRNRREVRGDMKIYDVFCSGEFIGKIIDFDGLVDVIRDINSEIVVKETDEKSFISGDTVKNIIESQIE